MKIAKLLSTFFTLAVLVTFVLPNAVRSAEPEMKTVAVVSAAGYDDFVASVGKLANLAGYKEMFDAMLMFAQIEGIDKTKPIGAVLLTDGTEFFPFGFLPVADVSALDFPGIGELKEFYDESSQTFVLPNSQDNDQDDSQDDSVNAKVKLTERDGWLFITPEGKENLLPAGDPTALLDGLDQEYLIGSKIYAENIPVALIDTLLAPLRQQLADISSDSLASVDNSMKILFSALESVETVSGGLTVDSTSGDLSLRSNVEMKTGTMWYQALEQNRNPQTLWSDIYLPNDSVFTFCNSQIVIPEQKELLTQQYNSLFDEMISVLEGVMEGADEDEKNIETVRTVLDKIHKFVDASIASGRTDCAYALRNDLLFMFGTTIAGGENLIDILDLASESFSQIKDEQITALLKSFKINMSEFSGYKVSTFVLSDEMAGVITQFDPDLAGKTFAVLLGVRSDAIILLAGADKKMVSDTFKQLASAERTERPVAQPMGQFSLKNFGVLLAHLLPNAETPIAEAIETLAAGSDQAIGFVRHDISDSSERAELTIKGEFFQLVGEVVRSVMDTMNVDDDGTSDDLFDDEEESVE